MRVVISHEAFDAFAGTETYMFTVAQELAALGHDVLIYAQRTGPMADFARSHGLRATATAEELPASCDAVLAQDAASAFELAGRYPAAVRVLVAHSDFFALQAPPQFEGVCQAIVVLNDRVGRYVEQLAFHAPIVRLHQPIDLKRFRPSGHPPARPRRAVVIGNYVRGARAQLVEDACAKAALHVSWVGSHAEPTARPEHAVADADVVIGLGRCVLEAMAAGRAAYVYGIAGGDGWVTTASYEMLEADGFSGKLRGTPLGIDAMAHDLQGWNPGMGHANRELACAHHDACAHAIDLVALIRRLGAGDGEPLAHADELARLVRLEWQTYTRLASVLDQNGELRDQLEHAQRVAERSHAAEQEWAATAHEAGRQLAALQNTRRYRLAARIASPLDLLRRRFRRS